MAALQQSYSYNIRSWLTGISGDLFTERYGYDLNGNMTSRTKAVQLTDSSGNTTLANLVARNSYTGKELATETGLYDFCARYLETSMGRFTTIDPLAEKYPSVSPYVYCAGDPVNFVDPDGKSTNPVYDSTGCFRGTTKEGFTGAVILYDGDMDFSNMTSLELLSNNSSGAMGVKASTYDKVRFTLSGSAKSNIVMRELLKYTMKETGRKKVDPLYQNLYEKYKDIY